MRVVATRRVAGAMRDGRRRAEEGFEDITRRVDDGV